MVDSNFPLSVAKLKSKYEHLVNKVTSITSSNKTSTTQYPSNKAMVDYADTKLSLSGGTMTGAITMNANVINGNPVTLKAGSKSLIAKSDGTFTWDSEDVMTGHLYQHNIGCVYTGNTTHWWAVTIFNQDDTAFTLTTLATWLKNKGFTSIDNCYVNVSAITGTVTGYVATTSGGSPTSYKVWGNPVGGIYSTDGSVIYTKNNYNGYYSWTTSNSTLNDTVLTIL